MEKALVSVIVPAYKAEPYLAQCLDSILGQTYENIEILVINDGSPDKTGEICDAYAQKDSRIRVFHKENGGVSSARNVGLANAAGEYVVFCDSDDTLRDEYVSHLVKLATENNCQMSYCARAFWEDRASYETAAVPDLNPPKIMGSRQAMENLLRSRYIGGSPWCWLMERALLDGLSFDPALHLDEDYCFILQVLSRAKQICIDKTVLYNYYVNAQGIVRSDFNPKHLTSVDACEKMEAFLREQGLLEQMKDSMDSRFVVRAVLLLRKLRRNKALQKQYAPALCRVIRQHLNKKSKVFLTRQVQIHALLAKLHYKLYFGVIDLKK